MIRAACCLLCFLATGTPFVTRADDGPQDELRVLPKSFNGDVANQMMRSYLRRLSHEALDGRLAKLEAVKSPEAAADYQKTLKQFFFATIGQLPERTPLNARVAGRAKRDGYRVENVVFESQPGFFVTANLYLPALGGPHPGILLPCGHSANGKAAGAYQRASILLAKNGFIVLCFDPIGQGERRQLLDADGEPVFPGTTTEHMVEGIAPILLGRSLATYMIWDGMRAVDYLQSRPEVDPERIGCTGNSGGGNLTSFLMALDDRIDAAAPGCFLTTHRRKNESPGPGDAEQNLFAQIREGLDHPDFMLIRAPKPTLILAATRDFVPIEGTWEAFRQAKRFYARFGFPERIDLVETDDKHGFSVQLREGVTRFLSRWLLDRTVDVVEGDFPIAVDADLRCTPDGQVLKLDGARSIFDLNREYEAELAKKRAEFWKSHSQNEALATVRATTGIRRLDDLPAVGVEQPDVIRRGGYRIEKLILKPEVGIVLPALLFRPDTPTGERCLFLHDKGKTADLKAIEERVKRGETVLAVDVRDTGETRTRNWRYGRSAEFTGSAGAEWFMAYMLGKSYLAMRAEDILVSARYLRDTAETKDAVHVIAHGELGPPALHAAALQPELISSLKLTGSLKSWKQMIETPVTRNQLVNVVHGALQAYDLPDIAGTLSNRKK